LLDAILRAVGELGYEAASVREVLERSGAARQTFYRHFDDKRECFLEAYDASFARLEARVVAAANSQTDPEARIEAGLGELLCFLEEDPVVTRALIVEVHAAGPAAIARRIAAMRRLAAMFDAARLGASRIDVSSTVSADGIIGGIEVAIQAQVRAGRAEKLRSLLPELTAFATIASAGIEESPRSRARTGRESNARA